MSPVARKTSKVIIFDWDDTICPSSFVDQWKVDTFSDLPLQYQNSFNEIGKCAEKCLAEAAKHGEVIIITNSDDGWVKFSAERFVPNLLPILPKYRIVSARTRYERYYPGQPLCWKAAAFAHEVNEIYADKDVYGEQNDSDNSSKSEDDSDDPDIVDTSCESMDSLTSIIADESSDSFDSVDGGGESKTSICGNIFTRRPPVSVSGGRRKNLSTRGSSSFRPPRREIISFGDSMEERTAVKIVAGQLTSVSKSVMFLTSPTPLQLIGQLAMLTGHMKFVCEHESTLDLEISPDQAQKCAESIMERNNKKEMMASPALARTCGSSYVPRIRRTGSRSSEIIVAASSDAHHHTRMD